MSKDIDYSLYLVTNRDILENIDLISAIEEAIKGGVSIVQLREKNLEYDEFLALGKKVKKLTDSYSIPLIINDNIQIAKQLNCTGVHIGQDDEKLQTARQILGEDKIIGVSVSTIDEANRAIKNGADYLGIGTVFFTSTKKDIKTPIGLKGLKKVVECSSIPSVAIGGIDKQNLNSVLECGVDGVALISAILQNNSIKKSSKNLKNMIKEKRMENIVQLQKEIKEKNPIVFHITNSVTINDCANITLSAGASPLMSFCKEELEDILSFSSALVLNIGTMDYFMRDMVISAGVIANKLNIPVILDPVGVGASLSRKELVSKLLKEVKFAVIKGNSAEIKTLLGLDITKAGVDSKEDFNDTKQIKNLALKLDTVIAMSGKVDIISDGQKVAKVKNGVEILAKVSGTGCMSASLIGSACGASSDYFSSAVFAMCMMGISGELSLRQNPKIGNGSLKTALLDNIYNLSEKKFRKRLKVNMV